MKKNVVEYSKLVEKNINPNCIKKNKKPEQEVPDIEEEEEEEEEEEDYLRT